MYRVMPFPRQSDLREQVTPWSGDAPAEDGYYWAFLMGRMVVVELCRGGRLVGLVGFDDQLEPGDVDWWGPRVREPDLLVPGERMRVKRPGW